MLLRIEMAEDPSTLVYLLHLVEWDGYGTVPRSTPEPVPTCPYINPD